MDAIIAIAVIVGFLIIFALIAVASIKKNRVLTDILQVYDGIHKEGGFAESMGLIGAELKKRGVDIGGFLQKNKLDQSLESGLFKIGMSGKSSAALAFFRGVPVKASPANPDDARLIDTFGSNLTFVPVLMNQDEPCWKLAGCPATDCACYGKESPDCWLHSGVCYHGQSLQSPKQKMAVCLACASFRPVGVFAVRGEKAQYAFEFIRDYMQAAVRSFVNYERVLYAATRDYLTGLHNKRSFGEILHHLWTISNRSQMQLSLCMFDLDHFKKLNDSRGHQVGDIVLRELAQLVQSLVRESDYVARYGGEEFAIIFPSTCKDDAFYVAEKIRSAVQQQEFAKNVSITVSMGITNMKSDGAKSPDDLIHLADVALYRAKEQRNNVIAYQTSFGSHIPTKEERTAGKPSQRDEVRKAPAGRRKPAPPVGDYIIIK